jgi:hypothetical protein
VDDQNPSATAQPREITHTQCSLVRIFPFSFPFSASRSPDVTGPGRSSTRSLRHWKAIHQKGEGQHKQIRNQIEMQIHQVE